MQKTFLLPMTKKPVLNNINLCLEPGKPHLLLGTSGCGKSTLAKLLCGLYPPESGKIFLNEQNIHDYDLRSVRQTIAYFSQTPCLFSGKIYDNMLLVKPDATEAEIDRAIKVSGRLELIAQLPNGIYTEVGEQGGFLSRRRRQRVALACLFLLDPQVLISDEPTSSLDEQVSAEITNYLSALAEHKTVFVITHNPALFGDKANILHFHELEVKQ
ncbi:ATP-binding cassette domain-containing protein [Bartonella sp. DGB2]|uniref:ATP-binding cassette domain-containing protein n=1 Tax=Bartonella sp. DGB2 TaxID=3388426 RepID=UPI00398FDBD9